MSKLAGRPEMAARTEGPAVRNTHPVRSRQRILDATLEIIERSGFPADDDLRTFLRRWLEPAMTPA